MITVLITGVNGTIGLELARILLSSGKYQVIGLDLQDDGLGKVLGNDNFAFIKQDITRPFSLSATQNRVDILIHCAALVHRGAKDLSRGNYLRVNHLGTQNVLTALKNKHLKQILFLSTVSVYGRIAKGIIPDETTEALPADFYGESKLLAEGGIKKFSQSSGIPYSIFRLTPVYGPRFLLSLKKRILFPWEMAFYKISKGDQLVSICSISNVMNVVTDAILQPKYYHQTLIVKDLNDYLITDLIKVYRTHLVRWKKPVVTIPHSLPRSLFTLIKLVFPDTGSWLLYQLDKVALNARYANTQLLALSAPVHWDLERTLRIR